MGNHARQGTAFECALLEERHPSITLKNIEVWLNARVHRVRLDAEEGLGQLPLCPLQDLVRDMS